MIDSLRRPITLANDQSVQIGVSIGSACVPNHASNRPMLVASADKALYEVKRTSKHSYAMAASRWPSKQAHPTPGTKPVSSYIDTGFPLSDF